MRNEKQCHILDAAFKVFARFGLKKTSIDDIAKAAEMSRQGVYLHFKNKDEIFKSAVEKYLADQNDAAILVLSQAKPVDERLLHGLQEWFGKSIGLIHQDAIDVVQEGSLVLKPIFDDYTRGFKAAMAKAIHKDAKADKRTADDIAEILHACGLTWKHEMSSQDEFQKRMKTTIKIALAGISAKKI
ncbi:MAG: TetR/AcrR family transcriptional regulator [Bdellovibrionota bacterium]|nr:MAG: TetR/AcrR family transcriptional regulator [Pseudomonadota bacterium]